MSLNYYSSKHPKLKGDLTAAREQLFAALDQYAELCLNIRNTHHQASSKQSTGFPWSELASELPFLPLLEARLQEATQNLNRAYELGQARTSPAYPPHIDKLPDEILTQIFRLAQPRDLHPTGKYGTTRAFAGVKLLLHAPRLRILHFGLNLEFDRDSPTNNTSIRLNDLEVLYLAASRRYGPEDTEYEIQRIMRHIAPGSKPLRLTLDLAGYHEQEPIETMKAFFSRSHILLNCAPHLTNLVFDRCRYDMLYDFRQARSQVIKLDSWIVRGSPVYIEDLEQLLKQYSARSIIMSNCRLFSKEDGPVEIPESDLGEWGFQLPDNVQYLNPDFSSDPTADWNNLE
ncbi:hypothetical protein RSAG8_11544, partial [Rhizoctonia solani AG-8 WAC10335]